MVTKLNKQKALYYAEYTHSCSYGSSIRSEQILECIKEIDKIKDSINIEVPMEAIEYDYQIYLSYACIKAHIYIIYSHVLAIARCLCDGGNPDSFMNEYVREVFTEDQQAHSKTEAIHVSIGISWGFDVSLSTIF